MIESENYQKVVFYYTHHLWSAERVQNAVGKWITQEEADAILAS